MSDYTRRKGERRALESGDPRDEVDYLVRISTDRVFSAEHYQRTRELVIESHLDSDHRETLCRLVRKHDKDNSFEYLSDEELVHAMPIINHFLDSGFSIYTEEERRSFDVLDPETYPSLIIKGDYKSGTNSNGSPGPGNVNEVLSGLVKCVGVTGKSDESHPDYLELCTDLVNHNYQGLKDIPILYGCLYTIIVFNGKKYHLKFLDNKVVDNYNKDYPLRFEAIQKKLKKLGIEDAQQEIEAGASQ